MKQYCVIGYPIKHSLSPKIHNRAFKKCGIKARYEAIEVKPAKLAEFMKTFRLCYAGANVTIPHKERIMRFLDKLSPEAKAIGAVNTIVNRNGKLIGYNTDLHGAMEALRKTVKSLKGKKVMVLGAGGAARAIAYGLKKAGAKITIVNRTFSRAKKMAAQFQCEYGTFSSLRALLSLRAFSSLRAKRSNLAFDILINATSVGMWPNINETPLPNLKNLLQTTCIIGKHAIYSPPFLVMDIIYRPRLTKLLKDAKRAGCRIITGDRMLLAQAAKSFELWTGKKVPI